MDWILTALIISLIANVFGIPLAILKSADIIRKWRKEKSDDYNKQIELKQKIPKEPLIRFINIDASVGLLLERLIILKFEIRNMGDFDTTITIHKAELKAKGLGRFPVSAKSTLINRIDVKAKKKKTDCRMQFSLLDRFATNWAEGKVKFHYIFITSAGTEKKRTSKWIDIRKIYDRIFL